MAHAVSLLAAVVATWALVAGDAQSCNPQSILITKFKDGLPQMDEAALAAHVAEALGKPNYQTLSKIPDKIFDGLTCMDGRSDEAVLSAPGGDVGEFILVLHAIENLSGKSLTQFNIDMLLVNLLALDSRTDFRMCSDTAAFSKLCESSGFCAVTGNDDIQMPAEGIQDELLSRLVMPENMGGEHLKKMLTHPNLYGVRKELTEMAIKAFFRVMWNNLGVPLAPESHDEVAGKLDLTILAGPHREEGLISVYSPSTPDTKCQLQTLMVKPISTRGHSLRVLYPNALAEARMHTVPLLATEARKMGLLKIDVSNKMVLDEVKSRGTQILDTSLDQMALERGGHQNLAGYPHYKVQLPAACCPETFMNSRGKSVGIEWSEVARPAGRNRIEQACSRDSVSVEVSPLSGPEDQLRLDGYSIKQVREHFLLDSGIPFVFVDPVEDGVGAVDGRNIESTLSVPGGSVGEFATVLAVIQEAFPTVQLDVKEMLTNYVLSMKAPTFTLYTDIDTMDSICSTIDKGMKDRSVCPDPSLPLNQKLEQLVMAFQRPNPAVMSQMVPLLTSSDGSGVGDPYLKFLMSDVPVKTGRGQNGGVRLADTEKRVLKAIQSAIKSHSDDARLMSKLGSNWQKSQVGLLRRVFAVEGQLGELKQSMKRQVRIAAAIRECVVEKPELLAPVLKNTGSMDVMSKCGDALKRLVVYIAEIDGDGALADGKTDKDALHKKVGSLVPQVIKAFFELLWANPDKAYSPYAGGIATKMDLVVLQGQHHEHAFAKVGIAASCGKNPMSPMLHSLDKHQETSIWVWHQQGSKAYRKGLLNFAGRYVKGMDEDTKLKLGRRADDNADGVMKRFISSNFFEMPIYDVQFSEECCVSQ